MIREGQGQLRLQVQTPGAGNAPREVAVERSSIDGAYTPRDTPRGDKENAGSNSDNLRKQLAETAQQAKETSAVLQTQLIGQIAACKSAEAQLELREEELKKIKMQLAQAQETQHSGCTSANSTAAQSGYAHAEASGASLQALQQDMAQANQAARAMIDDCQHRCTDTERALTAAALAAHTASFPRAAQTPAEIAQVVDRDVIHVAKPGAALTVELVLLKGQCLKVSPPSTSPNPHAHARARMHARARTHACTRITRK